MVKTCHVTNDFKEQLKGDFIYARPSTKTKFSGVFPHIFDCSARYGRASGNLQDVINHRNEGYKPSYVIPHKGLDLSSASYTVLDSTSKLMVRMDKGTKDELRELFDSYYVDAVVIPPYAGRLQMIREIYTSWRNITREIWFYDFESVEVNKEAAVIGELPIITGIITSYVNEVSKRGWLLNYSTTPSDLLGNFIYDHTLLDKDFIYGILYNKYVLECWLKGIRPMGLLEFLKGE
jgi:hypothetical protein